MRTVIFGLPWDLGAVGGVSEVVRGLVRSATASGEVRPVFLVADYGARLPRLDTIAVEGGVRVPRIATRFVDPYSSGRHFVLRMKAGLQWPLNVALTARALAKFAPAAVNVHYPGPWCLTLLAAVRLGAPGARVALSFHGADIATIEDGSAIERAHWKRLVERVDAVTTCSESLRTRLHAALGGAPPCPSHAIPNGIDAAVLDAAASDAVLPEALRGRRYVVNVGTFEHKKGQDVLLRAFARLAPRHPDLVLALLGRDGPTRGPVEQLARELGVDARVRVLADVPHGAALAAIRSAAAFALSSRREPFGIVLLEAAHFRVPIVASAVDGVPEVVSDDVTALLVPPDDPVALAASLDRILGDRALAERLTAAARLDTSTRFGFAETYRRYVEAVLGAAPDGAPRHASRGSAALPEAPTHR